MPTDRHPILHGHFPDWHALRSHLEKMIHNPGFWAIAVLGGLLALMLVFSFFGVAKNPPALLTPYGYPFYPYVP